MKEKRHCGSPAAFGSERWTVRFTSEGRPSPARTMCLLTHQFVSTTESEPIPTSVHAFLPREAKANVYTGKRANAGKQESFWQ